MESLKLSQLKSEDVLTVEPGALATCQARPPESVMSVLRLCDGVRTIREVVGGCRYHPATTLQVVFKAMDLGFVRKAPDPEPALNSVEAEEPDMDVGVSAVSHHVPSDILSNSIEFYQKLVKTDDSEPVGPSAQRPRRAFSLELAAVEADESGEDAGGVAAGFEAIDEEFFGSYVPEEPLSRSDLVAMGAIRLPRKPKPSRRNGNGRNGSGRNGSGRNGSGRKASGHQATAGNRPVEKTSDSKGRPAKGWTNRMAGWIVGFLSF